MSCINRRQYTRYTFCINNGIKTSLLSKTFDTVILPVFCACMIAARGVFSGIHTGILKMQYEVRMDTEFIPASCLFGRLNLRCAWLQIDSAFT